MKTEKGNPERVGLPLEREMECTVSEDLADATGSAKCRCYGREDADENLHHPLDGFPFHDDLLSIW